MEIYRRMGLAQKIRDAGFPRDAPMDVFIVTSLIEPPLLHLPYPSVAQAQAQIAACRDASMPLEPYQLISQYTLEPLLKAVADAMPNVDVRYGCEFVSFDQDGGSVARPRQDRRRRDRGAERALSGRLRRRHQRGAPATRHQAAGRSQSDAIPPGVVPLRRPVRPHPDRQGAALSRRRQPGDVPDRAGFDQAFHLAFGGRQRRRHGDDVREDRRHAGRLRNAVGRAMAAELAAGGQLRPGPASISPATRCIW